MEPNQYYGYEQPTYTQQEDPQARKRRIIIGSVGLLLFITVLIIVLSIVFSSPTIRPEVARITAMQFEIARVADIGVESDDSRRATQVLATNVRATSLTNVAQLTIWANANFANDFTNNTLQSQMSEETDAALAAATETNEFNETFEEAMVILLNGANDEITAQFSKFADYPDLQAILNKVGETNNQLLESISSSE